MTKLSYGSWKTVILVTHKNCGIWCKKDEVKIVEGYFPTTDSPNCVTLWYKNKIWEEHAYFP